MYKYRGTEVNEVRPNLKWVIIYYVISFLNLVPVIIFSIRSFGRSIAAREKKKVILIASGFFVSDSLLFFGYFSFPTNDDNTTGFHTD